MSFYTSPRLVMFHPKMGVHRLKMVIFEHVVLSGVTQLE